MSVRDLITLIEGSMLDNAGGMASEIDWEARELEKANSIDFKYKKGDGITSSSRNNG